MNYYERFQFCPQCGARYGRASFEAGDVLLRCGECEYVFYQNSKPSATVVIPRRERTSEVLLLTRATEPNKGKLALPGGLLRYGEDPAAGARREAREETLLDVSVERLLCAHLVDYVFQGSHISVMEVAFLARPIDADLGSLQTEEARHLAFYPVGELLRNPMRLAFPEQRVPLNAYYEWLLVQQDTAADERG